VKALIRFRGDSYWRENVSNKIVAQYPVPYKAVGAVSVNHLGFSKIEHPIAHKSFVCNFSVFRREVLSHAASFI
jgi:hypothetical protein